ncbi:MAG: hypothetical protein H0U74_11370 [Bradymonadaceae bacterium]|nr:hypothetical protein [Lujinxingiaceae bacterium]
MADSGSGRLSTNPADRRSSVRVRSLLPISVTPIAVDEIPALEARILDMAVIEADSVLHDLDDWSDRTDDLPREMLFMLNEVRALRMQVGEIQRVIERHGKATLQPHWVELNDQGLWIGKREDLGPWAIGEFAEIRLQIPSIHTPEILALGEVVRVDLESGREGAGEAYGFRAISQPHKHAISRYALRRERQQARSVRFSFDP